MLLFSSEKCCDYHLMLYVNLSQYVQKWPGNLCTGQGKGQGKSSQGTFCQISGGNPVLLHPCKMHLKVNLTVIHVHFLHLAFTQILT